MLQTGEFCFFFLYSLVEFLIILYASVYPGAESSIHLELQDTELWSRFESLSTEMM
jgi:hypothetical protein